jgi:hypothetical protein
VSYTAANAPAEVKSASASVPLVGIDRGNVWDKTIFSGLFGAVHVQVIVKAFLIQQCLMVASPDDLAMGDDQHLIGFAGSREAVGNNETGAAPHKSCQSFLQMPFGARVHVAGGCVEDEDVGVGQDGACNSQQLALPLAEIAAAFGQGLVAMREAVDKAVGVGKLVGALSLTDKAIKLGIRHPWNEAQCRSDRVRSATAYQTSCSQVKGVLYVDGVHDHPFGIRLILV